MKRPRKTNQSKLLKIRIKSRDKRTTLLNHNQLIISEDFKDQSVIEHGRFDVVTNGVYEWAFLIQLTDESRGICVRLRLERVDLTKSITSSTAWFFVNV